MKKNFKKNNYLKKKKTLLHSTCMLEAISRATFYISREGSSSAEIGCTQAFKIPSRTEQNAIMWLRGDAVISFTVSYLKLLSIIQMSVFYLLFIFE